MKKILVIFYKNYLRLQLHESFYFTFLQNFFSCEKFVHVNIGGAVKFFTTFIDKDVKKYNT